MSLALAEGLGALWIRQGLILSILTRTHTHPSTRTHTHAHTPPHKKKKKKPEPDKIKATVLRSASPGLMLPLASAMPAWLMTLDQPWPRDKDLTDIPVRPNFISLAWPRFGPGWGISPNNDPIERWERESPPSWEGEKKNGVHCRKPGVSFKVFIEWGLSRSRQEWQLLPMYNTKYIIIRPVWPGMKSKLQ